MGVSVKPLARRVQGDILLTMTIRGGIFVASGIHSLEIAVVDALESLIARQEMQVAEQQARLSKLKMIKEALQDAEVSAAVREYLETSNLDDAATIEDDPGFSSVMDEKTPHERILHYLRESGNVPATIVALAIAAKTSEANVRRIVYKAHAEDFEKVGVTPTREALYRINPDATEE
jgi:hypothetical protein